MIKYIIVLNTLLIFFIINTLYTNNTITNLSKKYDVSFINVDYNTRELIIDTLSNIDNETTYKIWEETIVNLIKNNKNNMIDDIINIGKKINKRQATTNEIYTLVNILKEHSKYANELLKNV